MVHIDNELSAFEGYDMGFDIAILNISMERYPDENIF